VRSGGLEGKPRPYHLDFSELLLLLMVSFDYLIIKLARFSRSSSLFSFLPCYYAPLALGNSCRLGILCDRSFHIHVDLIIVTGIACGLCA
jgi:hypothetical protein